MSSTQPIRMAASTTRTGPTLANRKITSVQSSASLGARACRRLTTAPTGTTTIGGEKARLMERASVWVIGWWRGLCALGRQRGDEPVAVGPKQGSAPLEPG